MTKKELRVEMRKRRSTLSVERILLYSGCITDFLIHTTEYANATTILAYASFSSEVDTHFLIQKAWHDGKKVAVPKCISNTEMQFEYIERFEDMAPGKYGIQEPTTGRTVSFENESCIILLPCVGYTGKGDRLGYGGGYYDRFLKQHTDIPRILLAYSMQEIDVLPNDDMDVPADIIISEVGVIRTKAKTVSMKGEQ